MSKQTAVKWLIDEIEKHYMINNARLDPTIIMELEKQAKEMEKQIIAQSFEDGDYNYFYNPDNGKEFENGIEYYNKKFKSE